METSPFLKELRREGTKEELTAQAGLDIALHYGQGGGGLILWVSPVSNEESITRRSGAKAKREKLLRARAGGCLTS